MIDYSALLYDPVYAELGVPATLSAGTAGEIALTVIDETRRALVTTSAVASGLRVTTSQQTHGVGPAAVARIPELTGKGIARDDYMNATLAFNGRNWMVRSYDLLGSPNGEDLGEVRFLLKAIGSSDG